MQKWLLPICLVALSSCATFNDVDKERFQINENQTVSDKQTKLMWASTDNRQSLTWMAAEEYCNSYTGGGFQDWRMPKRSELMTLIKANISSKKGEVIQISSNLIWAAETKNNQGTYCDFKMHGCSWMEKVVSITLHALPVRETKAIPVIQSPPPTDTIKAQSPKQKLLIINSLYRQNLITKEEYEGKRTAILNEL